MDGVDCQKGYNSHYSPKGNEIVGMSLSFLFCCFFCVYFVGWLTYFLMPVFEPEQILPRYVITFATQDAEEREQEG